MTKPRTIGNMVAPWRFIMFVLVGVATLFPAIPWFGSSLGIMVAFDLAAAMFLISCINLLNIDDPIVIERLAKKNDAARTFLLVITLLVIAVLLKAVAAETVAGRPEPATKALIIMTLVIAWLFSNMVYALHYAHMAYIQPPGGCAGFKFPGTDEPIYWDFVYFAFTCGMAFATADVEVTDRRVRKVVTFHCLAAFGFNIGVLAFTVNLLASGH